MNNRVVQLSVKNLLDVYQSGGLPRPEQHGTHPGLELGARENC